MARTDFPYQSFQDSEGNALSLGYILIAVSQDVQASSGLLCEGLPLRVSLDSSGVVTHIPQVWPNSQLLPSGSYYVVRAYTANGQLAFGPINVTV